MLPKETQIPCGNQLNRVTHHIGHNVGRRKGKNPQGASMEQRPGSKEPGTSTRSGENEERVTLVSADLRRRSIAPRLQDKRALVTGGSRGIGAAIVRRLASEGAHVGLTYASKKELARETAAEARAYGGEAFAIQADNADHDAVAAAVRKTTEELGGIDILVHSAGVGYFGPIQDITLEQLDEALAVNLRGTYLATQAAIPHMGRGGRIIMIGSGSSERSPFPGNTLYAMTKSGLSGLVRALSRDLAPQGITVNNVQPGPIDTDMNPANTDFADMVCEQVIALRRYGTPDEVAAMVAYVASSEAAYLTGATLTIDGGFAA